MSQELTPIFENFRRQLDRVSATGDTAIYDALDTARSILVNFRSDLPRLRKRIVIVTDGADTKSGMSAVDVCRSLQKAGIIVDSVQVGDQSDALLHAISTATGVDTSRISSPDSLTWVIGGYRFLPSTSLSDALSIFVSSLDPEFAFLIGWPGP
jgi:Mg-chelatase subunit ChlD